MMWSGQNHAAVIASPILGLICSLIAWLVTAKKQYGLLTVESTGSNNPMLAGNVVALLSPMVFIPILTFAFGSQRYDWQSMKQISLGDDSELAAAAHVDLEKIPGHHASDTTDAEATAKAEAEAKHLDRAAVISRGMTGLMTIALLVLWPMPMFATGYILSKKFFTGWVTVGIIWLFFSTGCVGIWPLVEGRHSMARTFKGIARDLAGKGRQEMEVMHGQAEQDSMGSGAQSPVNISEKMMEKQ
jgi:hypothetical protein